jgi:hypothetical protein
VEGRKEGRMEGRADGRTSKYDNEVHLHKQSY